MTEKTTFTSLVEAMLGEQQIIELDAQNRWNSKRLEVIVSIIKQLAERQQLNETYLLIAKKIASVDFYRDGNLGYRVENDLPAYIQQLSVRQLLTFVEAVNRNMPQFEEKDIDLECWADLYFLEVALSILNNIKATPPKPEGTIRVTMLNETTTLLDTLGIQGKPNELSQCGTVWDIRFPEDVRFSAPERIQCEYYNEHYEVAVQSQNFTLQGWVVILHYDAIWHVACPWLLIVFRLENINDEYRQQENPIQVLEER